MSFRIIRTLGKSGVQDSPSSTGQEMALSRRHSGIVLNEFQNEAHQGNVYIANIGVGTTVVDWVKTAYDADQPQFVIDVPAGVTIMPLRLEVMQETEAGTLGEVIWGFANANVGAGTSTAVTRSSGVGQYRPMLVNASGTEPDSSCSIYRNYTGNGTDVTTAGAHAIFRRFSSPFVLSDGDPQEARVWSHLADGPAPVIEGTGSLVCWIHGGSTAPTGFLTAIWAEFNT